MADVVPAVALEREVRVTHAGRSRRERRVVGDGRAVRTGRQEGGEQRGGDQGDGGGGACSPTRHRSSFRVRRNRPIDHTPPRWRPQPAKCQGEGMLPDAWRGLVDDAAVFPPGDAPLPEALTAYVDRAGAWWADLVGSFVVTDTALPGITEDVPVSVVVTGGAGAIAGALGYAKKSGKRVTGLEIALRDPDDLAGNARRVQAAVDAARAEGVLDEETPGLRRAAAGRSRPRLARRRGRRRRGRAPAQVPHGRPRGRQVPRAGDRRGLDRRGPRPRDAVQVHRRAAPRHRPPRPRDRVRAPRLPQRAARDPAGLRRRDPGGGRDPAGRPPTPTTWSPWPARRNSRATSPALVAGSPRSAAARCASRSTTWSGWVSSKEQHA